MKAKYIAWICSTALAVSACSDGAANKTSAADDTALGGVIGMLSAAEATNRVRALGALPGAIAITNCVDVVKLNGVAIPNGYSISAKAISDKEEVTCTVTGPSGASSSFPAHGASVQSASPGVSGGQTSSTVPTPRTSNDGPINCADFGMFVSAKGHSFMEKVQIVDEAKKAGRCTDSAP